MTKHYFTAIYAKGFPDDSILQMIEPDGSAVVKKDACNFHVHDWAPVNSDSFYARPIGIYRITGYAVMSDGGLLAYHDVKITPAKSYSLNFGERNNIMNFIELTMHKSGRKRHKCVLALPC